MEWFSLALEVWAANTALWLEASPFFSLLSHGSRNLMVPLRKNPCLMKLYVLGGNFEQFPLLAAVWLGEWLTFLNETSAFCCGWRLMKTQTFQRCLCFVGTPKMHLISAGN